MLALGIMRRRLEHYRKALDLNPNLPDCHYNYGVMLFSQKRLEEARDAFLQSPGHQSLLRQGTP